MSDKSTIRAWGWILGGFLLLRIPLLFFGYGLDPDSWRIAGAARWMTLHGGYRYSRPPGYPVVELLHIPALPGGWIVANVLALVLAALVGWALVRLARQFQVLHTGPVLALYAAAPVFVIHGATSMDYIWSLAAIAWSVVLCRRYPLWAGVLLGVATGCRITSAAFGLPLLLLLLPDNRYRDMVRLTLAAIIVACLSWSPVFWTYGLEFFRYVPSGHTLVEIASLLSQNLLGLPGAVMLCGILGSVAFRSDILQRLIGHSTDRFLLAAIGVGVLPFVLVPEDPAYCLPALFFGILWLGRHVSSRRLLWILAGLCLISTAILEPRIRRDFRLELRPGALVHTIHEQRGQLDRARYLLNAPVSRPACIIAGLERPVLGVLEPRLLAREPDDPMTVDGITYVYLLQEEEIVRLRNSGVQVYATRKSQVSTQLRYGFDLIAAGVQLLEQAQ